MYRQWKYRCGNRWGKDSKTNTSCMGCGDVQEHFFGCSDIAIKPKDMKNSNSTKISVVQEPLTKAKLITSTQSLQSITTTLPIGDMYNGCRSKLYYGKKINLSKAVSIYCSEICKSMCYENTYSTNDQEKAVICGQTCPILCSCV